MKKGVDKQGFVCYYIWALGRERQIQNGLNRFSKENQKTWKKYLTNAWECDKVNEFAAEAADELKRAAKRRVPCKLNNEKHAKCKHLGQIKQVVFCDERITANENSWVYSSGKTRKRLYVLQSTYDTIHREFDPGSGRTLAACLTHASRTELIGSRLRPSEFKFSGGRVSNAWGTCLSEGDNSWKRLLIPHDTF